MDHVSRKCPVCGKTQYTNLYYQRFVLPSRHPLKNGYNIVCCDYCGFVYANVETNQTELDAYYSDLSKYEDNKTSTGSRLSLLDKLRLKKAVSIITSILTDKDARIIDLGCANGGLLRELKNDNYTNVMGIDPSKNCVKNTRYIANCEAYIGSLSNLPQNIGEFSCVVLSHVIEHLYDLNTLENALDSLLAPEGIVYIEVPDGEHYVESVVSPFQEFNTEHINHFSIVALKNLLSRMGYACVHESAHNILVGDGTTYPVLSCVFNKTDKNCSITYDGKLRKSIQEYITKSKLLLEELDIKINRILKENPKIIIWGTGQLTMKLLAETSLQNANIYCFIDGNPINQERILFSKEIYPPSYLKNCPNYPILICTLLHQEEIIKILHKIGLYNKTLTLD